MEVSNLLLSFGNQLTLADRRLYNYLLHHAFKSLNKTLEHSIKLTDLQGVYGAGMPSLERIKESLRRLMRTLIEFEIEKDNQKNFVVINLLSSAKLNEKNKILNYIYPEFCRLLFTEPVLLEKCLIQAHFTYKYSNLLYEFLAAEYYKGNNFFEIELEDLRAGLHVEQDKMRNFTDFNRFVLEPALKEINSYASFATNFSQIKQGRKVTHLNFEFKNKYPFEKIKSAKQIIPQRRPQLFIDNPQQELAYAYLLNASTQERKRFFNLAQKKAMKAKKENINEELFDCPDLWFRWVVKEVLLEL